jgi:putative mRNA 3-end processing factor
MKVRFQRANHRTGNESIVLKFDGAVGGQTACVLVDSGRGVDVSSLLSDDEYLAGVLLTHPHLDHFRSLGENVIDGAPVLAAGPTAAVLETVLTENRRNDRVQGDVDGALDALEGVSGWRTLLGDGDVSVCPVPAGHAPGAAGFVVQFRDGDLARHVLVTGDMTTTEAGGYPATAMELPVDVEAMVVNVATTDDFEARFTDVVETTLARATQGFTTLATAGALAGVHLARVCDAAIARWALDVDLRLVGQTAKLYADLELPTDGVVLEPEFADPDTVLSAGDVTIAGPETPVGGSAKRLFETIRDDGNAALVQMTSGALETATAAACTTYAFEVRPHPTEAVVDGLVESHDPLHVVVAHESGADLDAYKDKYAAFVWANQDAIEQTLYVDGDWQAPPWVSERAERYVYGNTSEFGGNVVDDSEAALDATLPAVTASTVSLSAEGIDVPRLQERFETNESEATTRDATVDDDATLADVLARLDDVEARLAATIGDQFQVPVTVEEVDGETVLRLPSVVDVTDPDDVSVYVDRDTADAPDDRTDEEPDS